MQRAESPVSTTRTCARTSLRGLALLALTLALPACSPISYARQARSVERAVALAEAAHANEHARYEVTLARLLLEKAREQSGSAHYASALELLQRAEQTALRAQLLARARGGDGALR